MNLFYKGVYHVLVCSLLFFSTAIYAQRTGSMEELRHLFIGELSKSLAAGKLPSEKSIQLALFSGKELSQHRLNNQPADAFYIKATAADLLIGAASAAGIQNGVYWYLNHLGFRYYFPNEAWYFVPELQTAFRPVEKTVAPSYMHRRIWYAYGTGSNKADADYRKWVAANGLGGEEVNAGHAYDAIVARNKAVFQEHLEYFAQKVAKGVIPPNPKFDVTNEALVQLCIQDAFTQIEAKLKKSGSLPNMISMDPSDGGGFKASAGPGLNTPGEQAFYLANRVASAVRKKYPTVKVGTYAYYQHAAPPSFALEPNLVVLIATAMNQSAYRTDELIAAWKKKNITLGIRDYYGVMAWDWDLPGQPNGSRIGYVSQLKGYHESGIRLFSAETNIGWISRGLGHYIGAQLLWNIDSDVEELKHGFFKNMFGAAAGHMQQLFDAWQQYKQPLPLEGDLYQWSRLVESAAKSEKSEAVQVRIRQVKQYLHYVTLFKRWRNSNVDGDLVALLNYAYRIQDAGVAASYPLFRRLTAGAAQSKANMHFDDKNAVWKRNNQPVSDEETEQNFYADLHSFNQTEKTIVTTLPAKFPAAARQQQSNATALPTNLRGTHIVVFQLYDNKASINLSVGLIKAKAYKTLRLKIYPYNNDLQTNDAEILIQETIQPRQPIRPIGLESLKPGTYMAVIDDAKNGFTVSFTGAVAFGIVAGGPSRAWTFGRNNLVFEVKGVKTFSIKNDGSVTLRSPKGRIIDLQKKKGVFNIDVAPGEEGIWQLQKQIGVFNLQGVLPLVSSQEVFLLRKA